MMILIAAVSGRALAHSVRRAGFDPVVLDLFCDRDLEADVSANVCAKQSLRFSERKVLRAAKTLAAEAPLLYGAGFEGCPRTLRRLAEHRKLYGNSPDTLARVNAPASFFTLLDDLRLPHPEVCFTPPRSMRGWLAKRAGAAGGWHIGGRAGEDCYFQRRLSGRALSALFLANGNAAKVIGFNETWTVNVSRRPFCYGGAINQALIPSSTRAAIARFVERLTDRLALVGLNGIDFMFDGENIDVLEINARPPATFELYDADFSNGIVATHVRACEGSLPPALPACGRVRASAIVYAHSPVRISRNLRFPSHAADIPRIGTPIGAGEPVCSVRAEGSDFAEVKREVHLRANAINALLLEKAA